MLHQSLHIIDSFYRYPDRVRQRALQMQYFKPEELVGLRTQAYQPRGIRQRIETKFKIKIKYWEEDLNAIEASNGVFFRSLAKGAHAERVGIHYDDPPHWMMLLIYLTPNASVDAGTSLWRHRRTGLIARPTQRDARARGTTVKELEAILDRDGWNKRRWVEIDRIGNMFNRAVMFPGGFFHSATRHFGNNMRNGRLYQAFHFPATFI